MRTYEEFDGLRVGDRSGAAAGAQTVPDFTRGIFARVLDTVWAWQQRAAGRRALARLDDRMLRDIGLDRASADFEATKPFWRG